MGFSLKKLGKIVSAPVKQIKEEYKENQLKTVANALNPLGYATAKMFNQATGRNAGDLLFNSAQLIPAKLGEKYVDAPKNEKKQFKADMAKAQAEQEAALNEFNKNKAQSDAEKAASENLLSDRAAQRRRRAKSGREATILSQKLGDSGSEGRKTLLGL